MARADDDFIEWRGGENPAGKNIVQVWLREGSRNMDHADKFNWSWSYDDGPPEDLQIIAYRIGGKRTMKIIFKIRLRKMYWHIGGGWSILSIDFITEGCSALICSIGPIRMVIGAARGRT